MQCLRVELMHTNWVIKGYDQCVTCLADDPQNLVTRSSTLRTPKTLSQTTNSIHKHSSIRCKGKTQKKRSKLKVQLKSFDLQKETLKSQLQNSNYDQKKFEFKSAWNHILNCQNHVQVDYLERGVRDEDFGVGFTGFGRTVEKLRGFEDQGLIHDKSIRE